MAKTCSKPRKKRFCDFSPMHTGPEWDRIVHKSFLYFSKPDRAAFVPKIMTFNKKLIFKTFHKCQENCHILHSNWDSKLTKSDLSYEHRETLLKFSFHNMLWYIEDKIWCKKVATGHNWYNKFSHFQYFLLNKDV